MISIQNLQLTYRSSHGVHHATRGVTLDITEGQFYTLLGPSGCGKTTVLRCVAGLESPDEGEIRIGGERVFCSQSHIDVPPHKRPIGMVFQSYAIWPHMNVFDNVAFPLRQSRPRLSRAQIRERVGEALTVVKMTSFGTRPASFLSGGQQQRIAIARALIRRPKVLLLDEPLSNLDAKLREEMRLELRDLTRRLGVTTLFVTHEQSEALSMSDRIAVMRDGCIIQEQDPKGIYLSPQSAFVADFIGSANLVPAFIAHSAHSGPGSAIESSLGALSCAGETVGVLGGAATLVIRPEDIEIRGTETDGSNVVRGKVSTVSFLGEITHYVVDVNGQSLRVHARSQAFDSGDPISLWLPPERCRLVPQNDQP
jgi:iron(III) transport system ATP-binding protein